MLDSGKAKRSLPNRNNSVVECVRVKDVSIALPQVLDGVRVSTTETSNVRSLSRQKCLVLSSVWTLETAYVGAADCLEEVSTCV
jgi:hypothetical protein